MIFAYFYVQKMTTSFLLKHYITQFMQKISLFCISAAILHQKHKQCKKQISNSLYVPQFHLCDRLSLHAVLCK